MGNLSINDSLTDPERDLLAAAGFEEDRDLTALSPEMLHQELVKANEFLQLMDAPPSLKTVTQWIAATSDDIQATTQAAPKPSQKKPSAVSTVSKTKEKPSKPIAKASEKKSIAAAAPDATPADASPEAPDLAPPDSEAPAVTKYYNYEADPDVQEMLSKSPPALPIPEGKLINNQMPPDELPYAHLLNAAPGDLDVRVTAHESKINKASSNAPRSRNSGLVKVAEPRRDNKRNLDISRVRSLDHARAQPIPTPQSARPVPNTPQAAAQEERLRLLRTARESTNRGKDPNSRRFIRGVLHDRPYLVACGSIVFLLFQLSVLATLISLPLYVLADRFPHTFPKIPLGVLAFPGILIFFGIAYLIMAAKVKCRVCGQKVLWPRHCHKHVKAHHIRGLGYISALAFHVLTFRWFNCTFCGTAVRIKE